MKFTFLLPTIIAGTILFSACSENKYDIAEIKNIEATERSILVIGSAEMDVVPDEFELLIDIEEYYEEEFIKGMDWEDYETKVPIATIEDKLMKKLRSLGIKKRQITVRDIGNYWRHHSKEFKIRKRLAISLTDFSVINKLVGEIDLRGVDYMHIGELKHKDILDYRKEVKIEAIKAAKEKANYLLSALKKKAGDVITIKEREGDNSWGNFYWSYKPTYANSVLPGGGQADQASAPRSIELRYEIEAVFEIK